MGYGASAGISRAEADMRANDLHGLNMAEGLIQLQSAEIGLSQQEKMMELMQQQVQSGGLGGPGATQPDKFDALAQMSLQTRNVEQAEKLASAASRMRTNSAKADYYSNKAKLQQLNTMGGLLDGVVDEKSWEEANKLYTIQTGGQKSPYVKPDGTLLPYNPDWVKKFRDGITSTKDKAAIAVSKARVEASRASAASARANATLVPYRQKYLEARTDALGKQGVKPPAPSAVNLAYEEASQGLDLTDVNNKNMVKLKAHDIAETARQIVSKDGKTLQEATKQAAQEARESGEFGGIPLAEDAPGGVKNPIQISPVVRKKGFEKNMVYISDQPKHKGEMAVWTGTHFQPLKGPPPHIYADEPGGSGATIIGDSESDDAEADDDEDDL